MGVTMMANKNVLFVTLVARPCYSILSILKLFLSNLIDLLCLQVFQVPRSPDSVIFVSMTMTTMMTELIALPLVHACGVMIAQIRSL